MVGPCHRHLAGWSRLVHAFTYSMMLVMIVIIVIIITIDKMLSLT